MDDVTTQFPDIDALYDAYPEARLSIESDYGCWWKDDDGGNWRVTFIHATGQVYAIYQGGTITKALKIGDEDVAFVGAGDLRGPVVILGTVEPYHREGIGAPDPMEHILEDWAEVCGAQGSLTWVVERLAGDWEGYQEHLTGRQT